MKNFVYLLTFVVATFLTTPSLAHGQSEIVLGPSSSAVSFDATGSNSANVTFGTCNPNCSMQGAAAVTGQNGWSIGTWTLALNPGALTVNSNGMFSGSTGGTFTFQGLFGLTGTITGNFTLTYLSGSSVPQLNIQIANLQGTGGLAGFFAPGSSANLTYMLTQLVCSGMQGSCTFQNLFNKGIGDPAYGYGFYGQMLPAPEPTAGLLLGSGLLAIGTLLRRRKLARIEQL